MTTETTAVPAIETALAEYQPTAAALAALAHRFQGVAYDLTTAKGSAEARAARLELVRLRTGLEAKRKEIKAPALERSRLIDSEAKRITDAILALETPIDEQIKADEARREAEREARAEAERVRVANIRAQIAMIAGAPARLAGKPAERIAQTIETMEAVEIGGGFAEFEAEAKTVRAATLESLREMHAAAVAQEAEAARLVAERAELERLRAEQADRDRIERERVAAEQARIAEAMAAEQARRDAENARILAEQRAESVRLAALDAEVQARLLAAAAERQRLAEEQVAERHRADAEAAAARAEADRIAREVREAEERELAARREAIEHTEEAQRAEAARAAALAVEPEPAAAPSQPPLLQDCDRGLSVALASKPDAMRHARDAAAAIAAASVPDALLALLEPAGWSVRNHDGYCWLTERQMDIDNMDDDQVAEVVYRIKGADCGEETPADRHAGDFGAPESAETRP